MTTLLDHTGPLTRRAAPTDAVVATSPPAQAPPTAPVTRSTEPPALLPPTLTVLPWEDPVTEANGHSPHSRYVELFWLSVLGPTSTWLLRRLVDGLDEFPHGYIIDLEQTAQALGVPGTPTRTSPFGRALTRCVLFGMATQVGDDVAVRRNVPWLAHRHIARLPAHLKLAHHEWVLQAQEAAAQSHNHKRAEAIADVLLWAGDDVRHVQRQLVLLGSSTNVARAAAASAARRAGVR